MDLKNKNVLVIGGTSGLGLAIASRLHSLGAVVTVTGRELKSNPGFRFYKCDLSVMKDIYSLTDSMAAEKSCFDIIVNNAGVLSPPEYRETADRIEYSFQVNCISHLVINRGLIVAGCCREGCRFIAVTSPVYRNVKPSYSLPAIIGYRPFRTYSQSKFYMMQSYNYLMELPSDNKFLFTGFNPGIFGSAIGRMQKKWFRIVYSIGFYFMPGADRVAGRLIGLLTKTSPENGFIYTRPGGRVERIPELDDNGRKFYENLLSLAGRG